MQDIGCSMRRIAVHIKTQI
uniref:Uncharacterized protein n=4 Tax=Oryza TaxID=4527 RepID=A0A0D3FZX2_9ORYZ